MTSNPRYLLTLALMALCSLTTDAEDWTVNGKSYVNVNVGKVEPDRVHITYNGGIGTVMLSDLTPELQKRFNYDPVQARAAAKAQALHDAESDAAAAAQSKIDNAKLAKSDVDASKERAAITAPSRTDPNAIRYLHGTVSTKVDGGYDIYLVEPSAYEAMPYHVPLAGNNIDVVLESDKVYTVGQFLKIPVVENGIFTDSSGNHYKQFSDVITP